MPLRFDLGPFEELHIGRCMITNSHERSLFAVEGDMPILIRAGDFFRVLRTLKKLISADAFQADNLGPSKVARSANYVARVNGWKQRR